MGYTGGGSRVPDPTGSSTYFGTSYYVVVRRGTTVVRHGTPTTLILSRDYSGIPLGISVGLSPAATAGLSSALTVEVITCNLSVYILYYNPVNYL